MWRTWGGVGGSPLRIAWLVQHMLKGTVPTLGFSEAPMCRGKGNLSAVAHLIPSPRVTYLPGRSWGQLKNMVASLSLWSQDPSCAAGTTLVVPFVLQESPDPVAMGGLLPEKGNSSAVVPSPQICHMPVLSWLQDSTAWPLWAGGRHELHEPGSRGPAGTQPATIPSLLPPATASLGRQPMVLGAAGGGLFSLPQSLTPGR